MARRQNSRTVTVCGQQQLDVLKIDTVVSDGRHCVGCSRRRGRSISESTGAISQLSTVTLSLALWCHPMQLSNSPAHCSERFVVDQPSVATTDEAARGSSPLNAARYLIEPDANSFTSDYSELGEPIREHLAGVQIIGRDDLELSNTVASTNGGHGDVDNVDAFVEGGTSEKRNLRRQDNETEEQFARRVRKTNYLSLAQVHHQYM